MYHDYNEAQTKWNGVNTIKVLGAINFDINFIVDDLSEKLHGLRALQLMSNASVIRCCKDLI